MAEVELIALTSGSGDPIRRDSPPRACIDHICSRRDSMWHPIEIERWPDLPVPDKTLSDHFGVRVTVTERCEGPGAEDSEA